ncbi:hypothetical protein HYN46_14305 [Aquirhabdus parva]|uniref:Uncharacterized protein n=1 Tax=Aquirhabdus parva TaxID=2283318 RepID=A0A345P9E9_9GAMM|nr:hypothetical protein HYN46_14305 [Aquirhabdus parva]
MNAYVYKQLVFTALWVTIAFIILFFIKFYTHTLSIFLLVEYLAIILVGLITRYLVLRDKNPQ